MLTRHLTSEFQYVLTIFNWTLQNFAPATTKLSRGIRTPVTATRNDHCKVTLPWHEICNPSTDSASEASNIDIAKREILAPATQNASFQTRCQFALPGLVEDWFNFELGRNTRKIQMMGIEPADPSQISISVVENASSSLSSLVVVIIIFVISLRLICFIFILIIIFFFSFSSSSTSMISSDGVSAATFVRSSSSISSTSCSASPFFFFLFLVVSSVCVSNVGRQEAALDFGFLSFFGFFSLDFSKDAITAKAVFMLSSTTSEACFSSFVFLGVLNSFLSVIRLRLCWLIGTFTELVVNPAEWDIPFAAITSCVLLNSFGISRCGVGAGGDGAGLAGFGGAFGGCFGALVGICFGFTGGCSSCDDLGVLPVDAWRARSSRFTRCTGGALGGGCLYACWADGCLVTLFQCSMWSGSVKALSNFCLYDSKDPTVRPLEWSSKVIHLNSQYILIYWKRSAYCSVPARELALGVVMYS